MLLGKEAVVLKIFFSQEAFGRIINLLLFSIYFDTCHILGFVIYTWQQVQWIPNLDQSQWDHNIMNNENDKEEQEEQYEFTQPLYTMVTKKGEKITTK